MGLLVRTTNILYDSYFSGVSRIPCLGMEVLPGGYLQRWGQRCTIDF